MRSGCSVGSAQLCSFRRSSPSPSRWRRRRGRARGLRAAARPASPSRSRSRSGNAEKLLDMPGVVGVAVALNNAGKPVIEVYKEKGGIAGVPSSLEGVDVESVVTGIIEARARRPDRFPRPVPICPVRPRRRRDRHARRPRHGRHERLRALEQPRLRRHQQSPSVGDPIIQPGDVDGGSDLPTGSGRCTRTRRSSSTAATTRWTPYWRPRQWRTPAPRRRPTATGCRAR